MGSFGIHTVSYTHLGRHDAFNLSHERQSNKHLFSTLIKCKECGWSFRRTVRTYKNTYVRWVCSGRNGRGADSCPNKTVVDEEELIEVLQEYFTNVLKQKKKVIAHVVKMCIRDRFSIMRRGVTSVSNSGSCYILHIIRQIITDLSIKSF